MSESEKQIETRIMRAAQSCIAKSSPYFTRFLNEQQQTLIGRLGLPQGAQGYFFGGSGAKDPVRQCFGIFPSDYGYTKEQAEYCFPITAITFTFRRCDKVTHRDVLGTLMGLGIERDTIGDIYIDEGRAAVFVADSVAPLVLNTVIKIGGIGVICSEGLGFEPPAREFEDIRLSVASLRLDALVGQLAHTSRTAGTERFIKAQLVFVNCEPCDNCSRILSQGDVITIRGKGKFVLHEIAGTGRKGNIHITVKKYI